MDIYMTLATYWNNIEPMFWFVAWVMILKRCFATRANHAACLRQRSIANSVKNSFAGLFFYWMAFAVSSVAIASGNLSFDACVVAAMVFFCGRLAFACLSIYFCISFPGVLAFGGFGIRQCCLAVAQFAPRHETSLSAAVFIKLRKWFNFLALGTCLCLNWLRHSFSFLKTMFVPRAGQSACGFLNGIIGRRTLQPLIIITLLIASLASATFMKREYVNYPGETTQFRETIEFADVNGLLEDYYMLISTYDILEDGFVDGNDTAYGASWNGIINAPSMNVVYDEFEALVSDYLAIDGSNANTTIDIGSEDLTTTGAIDANGVDIHNDVVRVRTAKTPASASDTGNQGDIAWDADYIYVCTATNTWERTAIETWGGGTMVFEDGNTMLYEDGNTMVYEN